MRFSPGVSPVLSTPTASVGPRFSHSGDGVLTVAEFKAAMERYDHSTGNKSVFPLDAFPDALQRLMRPLDLDRTASA